MRKDRLGKVQSKMKELGLAAVTFAGLKTSDMPRRKHSHSLTGFTRPSSFVFARVSRSFTKRPSILGSRKKSISTWLKPEITLSIYNTGPATGRRHGGRLGKEAGPADFSGISENGDEKEKIGIDGMASDSERVRHLESGGVILVNFYPICWTSGLQTDEEVRVILR